MPIKPIVLQRRHAELGRIRLGAKRGGNGAPMKLESFRFTSPSGQYIHDLAELYGGEARPWDNNGKPEFEVFTDTHSIPVIAVKGGLSQWLETWSGGGIVHRCDGEMNVLTGDPCNPEDPAHKNAKPTTRLSLMLPELEAIGVWRLESKGWNAAAEIPAVAELAQYVGDLVPAVLHLVERRTVKDGKTSRFVVPVLDLKIGTARLREIVAAKSGGDLELPTGQRPALTAGSPQSDPYAAWFDRLATATSVEDCQTLWSQMLEARLVGTHAQENPAADPQRVAEFVKAFKAKGAELTREGSAGPAVSGQPATAGDVVDGVIVEDSDPDALWQQILDTGGQRGMTLDDVTTDFKTRMGDVIPDEASAAELRHYLELLTTGEAGAA